MMRRSESPLTVMGLMSGTSVDGVDACLVRLAEVDGRLDYNILAIARQDMPEALHTRLLDVMNKPLVHLETLCALNVAVGELFAKTALSLLHTHNLDASHVDCIGSHGQTVYHWPPSAKSNSRDQGYSLQIGEPSIIAEKTGIYTIGDFRVRDMSAGGQGAPLVCYADKLIFQSETLGRCIQNIGGIANVTVIPSRQAEEEFHQRVIAFDTGPGNMLMDAAMTHFFQKPYDADGAMAAQGFVNTDLLQALMGHPYLALDPPKTAGREQFGVPFFQLMFSRFPLVSGEDWIATLNEFTVQSMIEAYTRWILIHYHISEIILGGGGVYNTTLRNALQCGFEERGYRIAIKTHADFGIPDQSKEAMAFAILAWASYQHQVNNIPSCTGASHGVILGKHVPV